ncbi:MAG: hypothetical protein OXB88_07410 [Bacteriovoracales bacterium]|nr:hypothetical protein [Bacteriovoracales bacterium]
MVIDSVSLIENIFESARNFSQSSHQHSIYGKDDTYIKGRGKEDYIPLSFLKEKIKSLDSNELLKAGFIFSSYRLGDGDPFSNWYLSQFGKKPSQSLLKKLSILYIPDHKVIFDTVGIVSQCYEILQDHHVVINNKNLPTQMGEWYAKSIFGLKQVMSTSQRGFDFFIGDKHIEVKVHWGDRSSPKGVKIRKSLVRLSDFVIIMYVAKNFTIREICFLDSDFVERKFHGKSHVLFLKNQDISSYFFSKSSKHFDKIVNRSSLMKFASPLFAMRLDEQVWPG